MGYFCVGLAIIFNVYSQLIIKWQVSIAGNFPNLFVDKLWFLVRLSASPWVISAFVAIFLAFLVWAVALTKLELSKAYPMTSLTFVFVMILGTLLFNESLSAGKVLGGFFIVLGIVFASQG